MRLVFPSAAAAVLLLVVPALHADTYTFSVTSPAFTFAKAPYTTSDFISGTFSFVATLVPNTSFNYIPLTAIDLSDGYQTISTPAAEGYVSFATDAADSFTSFSVEADNPTGGQIITTSSATLGNSAEEGGLAEQAFNTEAATFTELSPTSGAPEPASLALLASGLLGFTGVLRRRLR